MRPAADACSFSLPVTGFAVIDVIAWALLSLGVGVAFVMFARRFGRGGVAVALVVIAVALGASTHARPAQADCDPAAVAPATGATTTSTSTTLVGSFAVPSATTIAATTTTLVAVLPGGGSVTSTTSTTVVGSSTPPAEVPEVPLTVLGPLSAVSMLAVGLVVRRRASASAH